MSASYSTNAPLNQQQFFVNWFRDSAPYIHAHRHSTFVISFGGEALLDEKFENHVHDFALLHSLGIRLVLVHGIRPQIDQRLQMRKLTPNFQEHLRITDDAALQCVKEAAGMVRIELEALLSMGLSNSPMSGAQIRVATGNFVTAKPLGVINGIDYQHTGAVRRIDSSSIRQQLTNNNVVIISPVGYSPSGETFNLCAEQVATEIAIALRAEKLLLLTEDDSKAVAEYKLAAQMTTTEANDFIANQETLPYSVSRPLKAAIAGCQEGVQRVHLITRNYDGGLLLELFNRDGIGTLISSTPYETLRAATLDDIAGILELIKPLEQQGKLIKRSREQLEIKISDYTIIERDGLIIGCSAFHPDPAGEHGEIACLAIHPDYQNAARGTRLLEHLYQQAMQFNIKKLYVLSTQTMHWFKERDFIAAEFATLPNQLQVFYNHQRNSKVLCKTLV